MDVGGPMVMAVSRRSLNAETRDQSQSSQGEICGGRVRQTEVLFRVLWISAISIIPSVFHVNSCIRDAMQSQKLTASLKGE